MYLQKQSTFLLADQLRCCFDSIGDNIKLLIDRPDGVYCFRFHKDRVYYVAEDIMKRAANVCRENLISLGVCFGKFTKTHKFRLQITALDYLAPYAMVRSWLNNYVWIYGQMVCFHLTSIYNRAVFKPIYLNFIELALYQS